MANRKAFFIANSTPIDIPVHTGAYASVQRRGLLTAPTAEHRSTPISGVRRRSRLSSIETCPFVQDLSAALAASQPSDQCGMMDRVFDSGGGQKSRVVTVRQFVGEGVR